MEYLGLYNKPKAVVHPERKKKKKFLEDFALRPFSKICIGSSLLVKIAQQ